MTVWVSTDKLDKKNHIGYTLRPQVRRGHKANPLLSLRSLRPELYLGGRLRRDRCGRCAAGSTRGVKPKAHRANPAVTQGQTGQPRADSTAPNPERRCGCGTRHDCATVSAQTTGSFHAAACQKLRQYASRCQSFVLSHVSDHQAEPIRGPEPPPATRNRSRAPSLACHNGTAPVARSVNSHRRYGPHSPADDLSRHLAASPRRRDLVVLTEPHSKPMRPRLCGGAPGFRDAMPSPRRESRETC